ncbi:MAG: sodium/solute symporter [Terracidiphilus sp.]|nr:sodium/solute symporter [Terracidiphilus sp.]
MTSLRLSASDYLVVIGYFVLLLTIGFWFKNRLKGVTDYFAGGNQIPWWMAGISHYMSSFSAFSFVAYAQMGYMYGWVSITLFWAAVPACLAGGALFARRWRRARVITPVQFLEMRFNGFLRQLFAWAGIPMRIFDDALKIFATGLFVSAASGISLFWSIVICGAVMVIYTYLGGVWALVVTDYIQFLMKVLAILLMCPLAFLAAGGARAAFRDLPHGFLAPVNGPYGWPYLIGFALLMLVSYNANWALAQKYYSVRTDTDASKAAYFSAFLNFLGAPLMILPAIVGRHFLPDLIAQHRTADAYVLLVTQLLPVGMVGIIMAAMFSATMAAVTGDFNVIASVLTQDIYHRLIRPAAGERHLLIVGRGVTIGLGALTTVLSLWVVFTNQQSLFNLMVTVLGLFMAPTLLPLLTGLIWRRLNWQGAFGGFLCGLFAAATMLGLRTWWPGAATLFGSTYNFEGVSLLANTAATILGMVAGSICFHNPAPKIAEVNRFFDELSRPLERDEMPEDTSNSVAPILAISTAGVGLLIAAAGLLSGSSAAREIDLCVGVFFAAISVIFVWYSRRKRIISS